MFLDVHERIMIIQYIPNTTNVMIFARILGNNCPQAGISSVPTKLEGISGTFSSNIRNVIVIDKIPSLKAINRSFP